MLLPVPPLAPVTTNRFMFGFGVSALSPMSACSLDARFSLKRPIKGDYVYYKWHCCINN